MKKILFLLLIGSFHFNASAQKKYQADWNSLQQFQIPDWFRDAKFGIYFHWGPYSVPAYDNEWYSINMYIEGTKANKHHLATYGSLDSFGYKDFIPMFKAEKFNADEWADLFVKAGAKFAGPIAEHADGFAMWDSKLTKWDAMDMGPHRDVVGEMSKAIKAKGLKFITTYHRHWLYAWYPTWNAKVDAGNAKYEGLYGPNVPKGTFVMADKPTIPLPDKKFNKEWYNRLKELVDNYQPDLVWFDNKMDIIDEKYRKKFLKYYYNQGLKNNQQVAATYKFTDFAAGAGILDFERSRLSKIRDTAWLTDDSIDWESWCDIQNPDYKTVNRLVDVLVDVVSKNGNLLLNITPKANGEIPAPVKERLLQIGDWLNTNGEAIYNTRPWKIYGEGSTKVVEGHLSERKNADNTAEDIRFTTHGDTLYAIVLDWPGTTLNIKSLGKQAGLFKQNIKNISLLGCDEKIDFTQNDNGLQIKLPAKKQGDFAHVFKIIPG